MFYPTFSPDDVPSFRRTNLPSVNLSGSNGLFNVDPLQLETDTNGLTAHSPQHTRILVVDDDVWIRDVLARVLIRHHYHVNTAASAEEALELLRFYPYDMLVCDMMMTGMSGLELTGLVKQIYTNLPIILITAHGDTGLMRDALRQGACDFIPKPFNIETIPLIIERNLERCALESVRNEAHNQSIMLSTVQALAAAIDAKEPFTAEHSRRVAKLSVSISHALCLPLAEQRHVELAAQVHDVGKIGTPDYILNKPGSLNEEEWKTIKEHPVKGAEIVGRVEQLTYVADIVRHHHERMDGTGYPAGLVGEEIPLLARVISVYHTKLPQEEALHRLNEAAGSQFDGTIVAAFVQLCAKSDPFSLELR
jgi:putative two-component system response regulator